MWVMKCPGQLRLWPAQSVASGADAVFYFRWRSCLFGTEQYWHGVLEHSGVPGRRYHDAAAMTPEMQKVYAEVAGGAVRSDVAIVTDFNDRWGFDQQPNSDDFSYTKALYPYYKALYRRGVNMDFIHGCDDFGKYKLVLLPYKYILTEEYAARLEDFVQNGGVLLTTCRSGVKNECNVPHEAVLPGYLRRAAGIKIEEYESIDCYAIEYKGRMYTGGTLVDWIKPETAEVLGQYTEDGVPYAAVTANTFGKGQLWYVGNVPDESLADSVIADLLETAGVRWFDLPERTEMVIQEKDGVSFVFLLNHSDAEQTFKLAGLKGMDLLSGQSGADWFTVKANDVAVIKSEGAFAGM